MKCKTIIRSDVSQQSNIWTTTFYDLYFSCIILRKQLPLLTRFSTTPPNPGQFAGSADNMNV